MLQKSEARYRKIIDHAPYGIIIHEDETIMYANKAACDTILGADPIGKSIGFYMKPEHRRIMQERMEDIKNGMEMAPFEINYGRSRLTTNTAMTSGTNC